MYVRKLTRSSDKPVEPYFPRHQERDTYVTLLQRADPPASDALLKAALVRRAVADVQRILRLRDDKQALQNLLQKGSIGDDLWNSFLAAEKELEAEIVEVHAEANSFVEGWGQVLFQTASEMLANEKTRAIAEQIPLERARNGIYTVCSTMLSVLLTNFQRQNMVRRRRAHRLPLSLPASQRRSLLPHQSLRHPSHRRNLALAQMAFPVRAKQVHAHLV